VATTNDVWAIVETDSEGRPKRLGFELTTLAAQLAQGYGGSAGAIVVGPAEAAQGVGAYGAASVFALSDPAYKTDPVGPASAAICQLIGRGTPRLVLFPSTPLGKDLAGRVCGRLGLGVNADTVAITADGGKVTAVTPAFNGALRVSSQFRAEGEETAAAVVRPGTVTAQKQEGAGAQVEEVAVPTDAKPGFTVVQSVAEKGGVPDLAGAQVIVAGGRGLGSAEKFSLVNELADALGGAVGATRAVVDMGWIPYSYQIGQTGKTVRPKLYIAVGISGEIQHKVGMQTAGTIITINKDPNAPLFQFSDLGIVGDLHQIVPALTAEIKRRKGQV
jgi:electron transfer flavoprotein alpha subunit